MTTVDPERVGDEAGTDEVTALAAVLARPGHVPAQRVAELDEDDDAVLGDHDPGGDAESVVLPRQRDEFTCPRCFLVVHVSRRRGDVCSDCV